MSKKPKVDHDYDTGKDKLTITIHQPEVCCAERSL
jgi:hypothetical protein